MLPFFPQEKPESCVSACLRMVLASTGFEASEADIYAGCETDFDGTLPSKAAAYANQIGFNATAPRLVDINELATMMASSHRYPIVFVNLIPILGLNINHAIVIESIEPTSETIIALDPAYPPTGRREWKLGLFEIGWKMAHRQTILVTTEKVG